MSRKFKAVLISVGGKPDPVLFTLNQTRPDHVWYFCSSGSRLTADEVQAQLDWRPAPRFIEVEKYEELGPCYRELRQKIISILKETKVDPEEVLVDYTAGTKTMSAALVLAAVEKFQEFGYVGGGSSGRAGLGVVISGLECRIVQPNPWRELAIRDVQRACDSWSACQFEVAADVLRQVAERSPLRQRFEAFAKLADGMAARHRLDFANARVDLEKARKMLRPIFEGRSDSPVSIADSSITICLSCSAKTANGALLRELLDNALRTEKQGRYEDAAARLYRAMEMQGQIWLAEASNGLVRNGKCAACDIDRLPHPLRELPFFQPDEHGTIKLSLEQCFRALSALHHERAKAIVKDLDTQSPGRSKWRIATEKRNASILAHGVEPVGKNGFDSMKHIATNFLAFDLEKEGNPIPQLKPEWFEPG